MFVINNQETLFRQRLSKLRIKKGVSEYQMSMDLGMSKGYIQSISSGRALPRMEKFFEICEYLDITPIEFFTQENEEPHLVRSLADIAQSLEKDEIELLISIAEHLKK